MTLPHRTSPPSIDSLRREIVAGRRSSESFIQQAMALTDSPQANHVLTQRFDMPALVQARAVDALRQAGAPVPPLAGLPVSVKDLYDVAGWPTWAGSRLRANAPAATVDATAVGRLRQAGAAIIGKTNMTEFAFSGVGINPHHGTPVNPCDSKLARIPGGSSSGAAVSVALGMAVAGLGSDTGGSIRIPAALCGLVGFKNTQARTPLAGAFPLSHTLDTVCALARSVHDCLTIDAILSGQPLEVVSRPLAGRRFLLPQTVVLDAMDSAVAQAFERAVNVLSAAGAQIVEASWSALADIPALNSPGGFSAVEAFFVHRDDMAARRDQFDPRVAARIALGEQVSAADYLQLHARRGDWIARANAHLRDYDAMLCPTVPLVAPPLQSLLDSDEAFFKANGLLLRNTFTTNYLDGCAFSLPCQAPAALPVGLMLAAPRGHDALLASVALAVESTLQAADLGLPGEP